MDYLDRQDYSSGDYFEDYYMNEEEKEMSMIAKDTQGITIPLLEGGVYYGVCSGIIDCGIQKNEMYNNESRKLMIQWNIVGEEVEINGEKVARIMHKQYGFSLNQKSTLRKDLEAWRGREFTEEELNGFDLNNILNIPCQLQIIEKERVGKNNVNAINGIMSIPKGTKIDKLDEKDLLVLDLEDPNTFANFEKIPSWIQDVIKRAKNYEESGMKKYVDENVKTDKEAEENDDGEYITVDDTEDLPF